MSQILNSLRLQRLRTLSHPRRTYATEPSAQPPPPQPQCEPPAATRPNPHRQLYKRGGFGRPIALNFLIAMCTFQVIYWSWLKLESMEIKQQKQDEIKSLEGQLKSLRDKTVTKAKEVKEEVVQKGSSWLPWK